LVCAPLLYYAVGDYAVLAMAGIVTLAYLIGTALRFNIRYAEPLIYEQTPERKLHIFLVELERFSNLVLAFSYIISVAFYLRLLSAFIFSGFFPSRPLFGKFINNSPIVVYRNIGFP
jgi:hypothetical protein